MNRIRCDFSTVALALLVLTACSHSRPLTDDYEVYSALLSQMEWARERVEGVTVETIVISELTDVYRFHPIDDGPWKNRDRLLEELADLQPSTIDSLAVCNREPIRLVPERFSNLNVHILSKPEEEELKDPTARWFRWWPNFYARFPSSQGFMTLSRVGFSADGTQALVYCGNQWRLNGGSGDLFLLTYQDGRWIVRDRYGLWVS